MAGPAQAGEGASPDQITPEELALAARNHGMPLEALRYPITPTGLHYLLIHYDVPAVDPEDWRLAVTGLVGRELSLSLKQVQSRPAVTKAVTLECAGNGRAQLQPRPISQPWLLEAVGTAQWTGTLLAPLLEEARLDRGAAEVLFTGLDHGVEGGVEQAYERSLSLDEATGPDVLLAYELNGEPLPPQHGFPVRLVVPGWYGMASVKWLGRITVLAEPFEGYQQTRSYRLRQDEDELGEPVTRMMPRALMVPPGVPDFLTRRRFVAPGRCPLQGRAWSGWGAIESVQVSTDGGRGWQEAELGEQGPALAWRSWSHTWQAEQPGDYELCCRAADKAGNLQPLEVPWNLGGYANNSVQRVPVTVGAGDRAP